MIFSATLNLVNSFLNINTTLIQEMIPDSTSLNVKTYITNDEYMEYQLKKSYDFLSNLEIMTYKCGKQEFFTYDLIELGNDEYFLKIGVLPQYLNHENFREKIYIQKFTLFDSTEGIVISYLTDVSLIAFGKLMGFKIPKAFKNILTETIIKNKFFKRLEINIQINEKIQEFTVFEIKLFMNGSITISTDTISLNDGLFLEEFPESARSSDNKHFILFLIYTLSRIDYNRFKMKCFPNLKTYIFELNISPPMFMLLRSFQSKMKFVYVEPKYTEIFFKMRKSKFSYISHRIRYIIKVHTYDSKVLNINNLMYTENFEQFSSESEEYTISSVEKQSFVEVTRNEHNVWSIIIKILAGSYDFDKKSNISFLFKGNKKYTRRFKFYFDNAKISLENEITLSVNIENPNEEILNVLKILNTIIDKGEGNIVFQLSEENYIKKTYAMCLDKGKTNIIVFQKLHKFPSLLLPPYFLMA